MLFIPEDKLKSSASINLAPMIDFLFLMLAFFATLAITRASIFDSNLSLVKLTPPQKNEASMYQREENFQVNLSVNKKGEYKWLTEMKDYPIESLLKVKKELTHQYNIGLLPTDKSKTNILLHIDKKAPWEAIAKLIFAVRETGFDAKPIFEPEKKARK